MSPSGWGVVPLPVQLVRTATSSVDLDAASATTPRTHPPPRLRVLDVLKDTWPLAAASVLTPAQAAFDLWLVRGLQDAHAVAAVGVGTILFNMVFWAFSFLRFSTVGLGAQALGAADGAESKRVLLRAVVISTGMGLAIVAITWPLLGLVVGRFAASPAVETAAAVYVGIRLLSVPAAFLNYALLGWFIAHKRMGLTMRTELVRVASAFALGILLVRGLDGDIAAVASAAVLGEAIALLYALFHARRIWRSGQGAWRWAEVFAWAPFRRVFAMSTNLFIRTLCLNVAFLGFTSGSAAFGEVTQAANAVLLNVYLLFAYPLGAFGQVTSAYVGRAYGAGDGPALRRAMSVTHGCALSAAALCAVFTWVFGLDLVSLLTTNPQVRATAADYLAHAAVLQVLAVLSFQFDGVAIGATRTAILRNSLLVAVGVFLAAQAILPGWACNHGLWLAFMIFMTVRSSAYLVALPRFRRLLP